MFIPLGSGRRCAAHAVARSRLGRAGESARTSAAALRRRDAQLGAQGARQRADGLERGVAMAALDAADLALADAGGGCKLLLGHVQGLAAADEIGGEAVTVFYPVQLGDRLWPFGFGLCNDLRVELLKGCHGIHLQWQVSAKTDMQSRDPASFTGLPPQEVVESCTRTGDLALLLAAAGIGAFIVAPEQENDAVTVGVAEDAQQDPLSRPGGAWGR